MTPVNKADRVEEVLKQMHRYAVNLEQGKNVLNAKIISNRIDIWVNKILEILVDDGV